MGFGTFAMTGSFVLSFAGFAEAASLDMSVLGRDILNIFTLIVDRHGDVVCLLGQQHFYTIGRL